MRAGSRLLLVRLSSLGDIVFALPVASALRRARPDAHLTWVVAPAYAPLVRCAPVDQVLPLQSRPLRAFLRGAADFRRAHQGAFDIALDIQGLAKTGYLVRQSGAPRRIGFAPGWRRERLGARWLTETTAPAGDHPHIIEQNLALLAPLGVVSPGVRFDLRLPDDKVASARALRQQIAGDRPLIALNPGTADARKQWAPDRYAALCDRLAADVQLPVLLLWGPGERALVERIASQTRHRPALAPDTDLLELAALLQEAQVCVAGDTGPLHLASALGTRCIALFGPTNPRRQGPWGSGHSTLYHGPTDRLDPRSPHGGGDLGRISVDEVFRAVVSGLPAGVPAPPTAAS